MSSGAFQTSLSGTGDAFVLGVNAAGTALTFCTYLGGTGSDSGYGIGVDGQDQVSVTGLTFSTNSREID